MRLRRRTRTPGHEITCLQAIRLVTAYLDDELDAADRRRFEAHLAECDHCTEHVKQIHVAIAWAGGLREDDLDPLARQDLLDLYRRWRGDDPAVDG